MTAIRDFTSQGASWKRSAVRAKNAMISTSHPLATAAGLKVLTEGGTAVDAAITASGVLCMAEPHMTGIGGDCFALVSPDGSARIEAMNASGRAPARANAETLRADGLEAIPQSSPHAVTIPGAVDGWWRLHQRYGKLDWDRLLWPALAYAEDGIPVHDRVAFDWQNLVGIVSHDADAARAYLKDGKPYRLGEMFRNPGLAGGIKLIQEHGRDGFYKGAMMEEMVEKLQSLGGVHAEEDFINTEAGFPEPISCTYKGHQVWECPPPGQGLAALIMLRLLDGYELDALDEAERIHIMAEAAKIAYHLRDTHIADPDFASVPVEEFLDDGYIKSCAAMIDPAKANHPVGGDFPDHSDTIYLAAVDRNGMAVSFINSLFDAFGTGIFTPHHGVLLHCRGKGFSLEDGHPNMLEGGKRPFHTIIPGMLTRDDTLIGPFGVMGGQYQAQGHAMLLSNILDRGMSPQAALETPRSFAIDGVLRLEAGFDATTVESLKALGHKVEYPHNAPIGGGQVICRDTGNGTWLAGSDPRKDGYASGY